MTDFLKIAMSMVVHFAHICAYGVETVKDEGVTLPFPQAKLATCIENNSDYSSVET